MINPLLRERVRFLKENEEGKDSMCDIMEQLMEKRCRNDMIELAREALAKEKYSLQEISELFKLPLSTIQELASSMSESKQE